MNRVLEKYLTQVKPELMKTFNYTSVMQAPKLDKIVINMGVGDAMSNSKALDEETPLPFGTAEVVYALKPPIFAPAPLKYASMPLMIACDEPTSLILKSKSLVDTLMKG